MASNASPKGDRVLHVCTHCKDEFLYSVEIFGALESLSVC